MAISSFGVAEMLQPSFERSLNEALPYNQLSFIEDLN